MQATLGKLSDDYDELVQENPKVTVVVKQLIEDLDQSFRNEVSTLSTEVVDLRNFVEGEL